MKVVAINGSARKDGNTAILIRHVFEELTKEGIETELIQLAGHAIRGCTGCDKCKELKNGKCVIENDPVNECIAKMTAADGIIRGRRKWPSLQTQGRGRGDRPPAARGTRWVKAVNMAYECRLIARREL